MWRSYFKALVLIVVTLLVGMLIGNTRQTVVSAQPAIEPQSPPSEQTASSTRVLVESYDTETLEMLRTHGAAMLVDYGSFSLWDLPEEETATRHAIPALSSPRNDFNTIYLRGATIDTTAEKPDVATSLQQNRTDAA